MHRFLQTRARSILTRLVFGLCGLGMIGVLYWFHRDLGIGAAVVAVYGILYWAKQRLDGQSPERGYPIVRYRGHGARPPSYSGMQRRQSLQHTQQKNQ